MSKYINGVCNICGNKMEVEVPTYKGEVYTEHIRGKRIQLCCTYKANEIIHRYRDMLK